MLRYRGYYYDADLGLYYLRSRYYDSNTGRFINADGYISTGTGLLGYNMYAYCNNNPVMYVDSEGNSPGLILGLVALGALLIVALTSCSPSSSAEPEAPKSIPDDIHMYEHGKGSPQDGKMNVEFSPESKNPSFQIEDSWRIKNKDDQREILEYIVNSEYYSYDTYGRTVDSMVIEWEAHNEINVIFPHDRLKSVDFDKNSEEWVKEDYWDYAIQEFLKGNW